MPLSQPTSTRRWLWPILWIVSLLVVAWVTAVAVNRTVSAQDLDLEQSGTSLVTVTQGTVERVVPATATVTWPRTVQIQAQSAGVLTRPVRDGEFDQGETLAWVNERPITVALGEVPVYREMAVGTRGSDVRQLQQMLIDVGTLPAGTTPNGVYEQSTAAAVKAWQAQAESSATPDGVVGLGDILFLAQLPAQIVFDPEVDVGANVGQGEALGSVRAASPDLTILSEGDAASELRSGMVATVSVPGGELDATLGAPRTTPDQQTEIALDMGGGCAADCRDVEDGDRLTVQVQTVPAQSGPVVPVAAIRQSDDGGPYVTTEAGDRIEVTILAADQGVAVVDGVEEGDTLRLVAAPDAREGGVSS